MADLRVVDDTAPFQECAACGYTWISHETVCPSCEYFGPPVEERSRLIRTGAEFILDQPTKLSPLWGDDDHILWVRGEPLMLVAPTGVGKTTLAIQIVAARLGILDSVLGYPVTDDGDRVLYMAMDRPPQIARAMARVFGEKHRDTLHERLVVWRGPPPADLGKQPEILLQLCRETNCQTVFIDSLKDAAVKLSDDEVGGNLNRAIQACTVADVQVAGLHHQRKRTSGGEKPKTLDDVYGSTWITAGAGSVVLLWGQAGNAIVELVHLKQPAEEVGPMLLEHDHGCGVTTIYRGFDLVTYLRDRGHQGATSTETARAMCEKADVTDNQRKKAQRQLDGLVVKGLATKNEPTLGGSGGSEGARYQWLEGFLLGTTCGKAPDMSTGQPISDQSTGQSPDTPDIEDKVPAQSNGQGDGHQRTVRAPDTAPPTRQGGGVREAPLEPDFDDEELPF